MRRVTYAGESFVTSDAIADAIVHFATAVAKNGTSEALSLPVLDGEGHAATIHMVVGPASEVISVPVESGDMLGVNVGAALEELHRRTAEAEKLSHGPGSKTGEEPPLAMPLDEDLPDVDAAGV